MEIISKEEFLKACNLKIEQDKEAQLKNKEWDAWYNELPSNCKQGFVFNGFSYSVNPNTRTITKEPIGGDVKLDEGKVDLVFLENSQMFTTSTINDQLGL